MSKISNREKLVKELLLSYKQTGHLFFKTMHQALQRQNSLPLAAVLVLKVLEQSGAQTQHQIARELHHSDAAVSRQVAILLDQHYITADSNPNNRRETLVALTEAGHDALRAIASTVDSHFNSILSPLTVDQIGQLLQSTKELEALLLQDQERLDNE